MVTIGELIEMLVELPLDTPVILSTDAEGNELRMVNGAGPRHVERLEHRFMEAVDEDNIDDYPGCVLTMEVW